MRRLQAFRAYSTILQKTIILSTFVFAACANSKEAETLARHVELCTRKNFTSVLYIFPKEGSKQADINFIEMRKSTRAPFVIYADFESNLEPIDIQTKATKYTQHHNVCSAIAIIVSPIARFNTQIFIDTGNDALTIFCKELIKWEKELHNLLRKYNKMWPLFRIENNLF
jgi:hypothetical protein